MVGVRDWSRNVAGRWVLENGDGFALRLEVGLSTASQTGRRWMGSPPAYFEHDTRNPTAGRLGGGGWVHLQPRQSGATLSPAIPPLGGLPAVGAPEERNVCSREGSVSP